MAETFATSTTEGSALSSEVRSMLELYHIGPDDLQRVRDFGEIALRRLDDYVTRFYDWMATQPEFDEHFSDDRKLERVKSMQVDYWNELFRARIDGHYLASRREVGDAHARIGLSLQAYFAAMSVSLNLFTDDLYDGQLGPDEYATAVRSLTKLMHMDTAVVVDAYAKMVAETIAEQGKSLMQMSTPVTAIWDGILLLPIVGIIDSKRAQDIMEAMLAKISHTQARAFILDIGGVAVVDTAVANHLIKITKATALMGCQCTISGISPAIARTIVELGIDVGSIRTTATMQDALSAAFETTGLQIRRT